ncbi:IclR family transcriptional regulator [Acinetobacter sp.]|jgi:IclR family pca regulon transcriptional regulator|uniref:IclR family transcriptional regulator n=1 Tax=Acinetobacter sp. TaxID=472 RepID=UPI002834EFFA|nr:IclR family transcriptional regulator [Acinetobacter sp.]MDR0236187.1 IclR family transcriptional regulator [Acinetobacter sp.]
MNSTTTDVLLEQNAESNTDERYLVPGLVRGLAILKLFDQHHQEMTISEIAEKLDVNRSSAFRLIHTLEFCGYLRKMSQKTYALNSNVMELGFNSLSKSSLTDIAAPIMRELRDKIKIAVHLSILEGTDIVFTSNVQSIGSFTSNVHIGTRWHAHATVIGQLLLSRLDEAEVIKRYEHFNDWKVYSDRTPQNLAALLERLKYVRSQSFMISWGHFNTDMAASAAPIYNQATQEVAAVLSVSCPLSTYSENVFKNAISQDVVDYADKISKFIYMQ